MINKTDLQSLISKYYLSGLIESVKIEIKDNTLTIKFTSPTKEMLGKVIYHNFDFLPESIIGISNTTQLNNLLKITNEELNLQYQSQNKIFTKLIISDKVFTLEYTLADIMIIPKSGEYKGGDEFLVQASLNEDIINSIIKAKNSLSNNETVTLQTIQNIVDGYKLEILFGENDEYSNKVSLNIEDIIYNPSIYEEIKHSYSSELFKEILSCNKDQALWLIEIGEGGILKLSFGSANMESEYFIVPKDI